MRRVWFPAYSALSHKVQNVFLFTVIWGFPQQAHGSFCPGCFGLRPRGEESGAKPATSRSPSALVFQSGKEDRSAARKMQTYKGCRLPPQALIINSYFIIPALKGRAINMQSIQYCSVLFFFPPFRLIFSYSPLFGHSICG